MPAAPQTPRTNLPASVWITAALVLAGALGGLVVLRWKDGAARQQRLSADERAYVRNLKLTDIEMHESTTYLNQRLVEVEGRITNIGQRKVSGVAVYCIFYNPSQQEVLRDRGSPLPPRGQPLQPGQSRSFRLAFDTVPGDWNQRVPDFHIAEIHLVE